MVIMILTLKVIFNRQSPYNPTAAETDESHQRMLVEREKHYIYGHCFSGRATHRCFLSWYIVGADDTLALSLAARACGREMCRFLFRFAVNKTFAIGCTAVGIISDSLVTRCVPARTNTYPSVVTAVRSGIHGVVQLFTSPERPLSLDYSGAMIIRMDAFGGFVF